MRVCWSVTDVYRNVGTDDFFVPQGRGVTRLTFLGAVRAAPGVAFSDKNALSTR